MRIGAPKEIFKGETRVAMTPESAVQLQKWGHECFVEAGAGEKAGFSDEAVFFSISSPTCVPRFVAASPADVRQRGVMLSITRIDHPAVGPFGRSKSAAGNTGTLTASQEGCQSRSFGPRLRSPKGKPAVRSG